MNAGAKVYPKAKTTNIFYKVGTQTGRQGQTGTYDPVCPPPLHHGLHAPLLVPPSRTPQGSYTLSCASCRRPGALCTAPCAPSGMQWVSISPMRPVQASPASASPVLGPCLGGQHSVACHASHTALCQRACSEHKTTDKSRSLALYSHV